MKYLLTDNGYYSAGNVDSCLDAKIEPLFPAGRDKHHPHWQDRFTEPAPLTGPASAVDRMKHRLKTTQRRKLYGLRKQTVEPVFGIIKSVMGFRQFLLRGLDSVRGEWNLVTMAAMGGVQNFVFLILLGIVELCFKVNHKLTHGLGVFRILCF